MRSDSGDDTGYRIAPNGKRLAGRHIEDARLHCPKPTHILSGAMRAVLSGIFFGHTGGGAMMPGLCAAAWGGRLCVGHVMRDLGEGGLKADAENRGHRKERQHRDRDDSMESGGPHARKCRNRELKWQSRERVFCPSRRLGSAERSSVNRGNVRQSRTYVCEKRGTCSRGLYASLSPKITR